MIFKPNDPEPIDDWMSMPDSARLLAFQPLTPVVPPPGSMTQGQAANARRQPQLQPSRTLVWVAPSFGRATGPLSIVASNAQLEATQILWGCAACDACTPCFGMGTDAPARPLISCPRFASFPRVSAHTSCALSPTAPSFRLILSLVPQVAA